MARRYKKTDTNEYPATIRGLSHEGRGIADINGKTTFIFNALPGEEVHFRYTHKRSQFCEGSSTYITKPSPERIAPQCPNFTICGGCSLQHMSADHQRNFKLKTVLELLDNQHIKPQSLLPILTGPEWNYRRKARIGVKFIHKKDQVMVGFRERSSSLIAHIDECHVLDTRIGFNIIELKKFIYQLESRSVIPQLEIAATDDEVAIIIRHLEPLPISDLEQINKFATQYNYKIYLQSKGIESIILLGEGSPKLQYTLPDYNLRFEFLPFQFTQINETINRKMVNQALQLLDLQLTDTVLDLFCGIGNFTLALATKAQHVTGIEADKLAIEQAKLNAELNTTTNCEFYVGNLFEDCSALPWARRHYDKILLDPPRSGAAQILELIPHWHPHTIVYVSCNPTTFARDAAILKQQGYQLQEFCTMDMFPHTQHTEVMGKFTRC